MFFASYSEGSIVELDASLFNSQFECIGIHTTDE